MPWGLIAGAVGLGAKIYDDDRKRKERHRAEKEAQQRAEAQREQQRLQLEAERQRHQQQMEAEKEAQRKKHAEAAEQHQRELQRIRDEEQKRIKENERRQQEEEIKRAPGGKDWEEQRLLGKGGFGEVWLWKNRNSGESRAVKKVRYGSDHQAIPEDVKQLKQEIKILSAVKHPRIVTYYGSEIIHDRLCIFEEYMKNGSVRGLIDKSGVINQNMAAKYIRQSLEGLKFLHERSPKIVHRDVKSANILLGDTGDVKLCDFGTSKHLNMIMTTTCSKFTPGPKATTTATGMTGTMYFMAPELFDINGFGTEVDIWSLGCTLVEMLTGNPPWHGLEMQVLNRQMCKEVKPIYTLPSGVSNEVESFLQACFKYDPKQRSSATQLLAHPFCTK